MKIYEKVSFATINFQRETEHLKRQQVLHRSRIVETESMVFALGVLPVPIAFSR